MAIAHGTMGTVSSGQTSIAPGFPASIAAGDLLVLWLANKYPNNSPTTPSGWTLLGQYSGGAGSSGVDSGNVYITAYYKIADGSETGTQTVTITSGNSARGRITRYTCGAGKTFAMAVAGGSSNTAGTAWAVTGDVDPGFTTGDFVIVYSAINSDVQTFSLEAITSAGVTFGSLTERQDDNTIQGDDSGVVFVDFATVVSGTSSLAPAYTMTANGTSGNQPAGASLILRIREIDATITGTASITLDTITVSSAGEVAVAGAAAITLDTMTVSSAGAVAIAGAAAITLDTIPVSSAGAVAIAGASAITLAGDSVASAGTVADAPEVTPSPASGWQGYTGWSGFGWR